MITSAALVTDLGRKGHEVLRNHGREQALKACAYCCPHANLPSISAATIIMRAISTANLRLHQMRAYPSVQVDMSSWESAAQARSWPHGEALFQAPCGGCISQGDECPAQQDISHVLIRSHQPMTALIWRPFPLLPAWYD